MEEEKVKLLKELETIEDLKNSSIFFDFDKLKKGMEISENVILGEDVKVPQKEYIDKDKLCQLAIKLIRNRLKRIEEIKQKGLNEEWIYQNKAVIKTFIKFFNITKEDIK